MLYRVDKKPDDLKGLIAAVFTGAGSASIIVDDRWGHFRQTSFFTGKFVVESAQAARSKDSLSISFVRYATEEDREFLEALNGAPWRPWHNCFSVLRSRWKTPSSKS